MPAFTLQQRALPSGDWGTVPVSYTPASAPAYGAIGTRQNSNGATSRNPALPTGRTSASWLFALVGSKNNATHTSSTSGWIKLAQVNSGANWTVSLWSYNPYTPGNDPTGSVGITVSWSGSVACFGSCWRWQDVQEIGVIDHATGSSATHTSPSINTSRVNSRVMYVDAAAANTAMDEPSTWTEHSDRGSATGATRDVIGSKAVATAGDPSGAISVTGANAAWVQWQVELMIAPPPPFTLSPSTHISASGEPTTEQLTAPGGSTFVAGRIQDDENPADNVDVEADEHTEMEWCIVATEYTVEGTTYQFRIEGLDTYSETPEWTYSAGPEEIAGVSITGTYASGVLNTRISVAGASVTGTYATAEISAATRIAGTSVTGTHADATLETGVSIAGTSKTDTYADADLDTSIGVEGQSVTGTYASSEINVPTRISGTSTTGTYADTELSTAVTIAGESVTETFAEANISTRVNIAGTSTTGTFADAQFDTQVSISGTSITGTYAFAEIETTDVTRISGTSTTGTYADATLDTTVSLSGESVTGTYAFLTFESAATTIAGTSITGTYAETTLDTQVSLNGESVTETYGDAGLSTTVAIGGTSVTGTYAFAELQTAFPVSIAGTSVTGTYASAEILTLVSLSGVSITGTYAWLTFVPDPPEWPIIGQGRWAPVIIGEARHAPVIVGRARNA